MLSRVANSIFWMCRYVERAENIARFVKVNWFLSLDNTTELIEQQWEPLVSTSGDREYFTNKYDEFNAENVIHFLTFDAEYLSSIRSSVRMARENARSIREILPIEMWECINRMYHICEDRFKQGNFLHEIDTFLDQVIRESNRFTGLTMTTMYRDDGWDFCQLGRMLERADKTSRILDVKYFYLLPTPQDVGTPLDHVQWAALLRSTSSYQNYRQKHGTTNPVKIVEMLLLDPQLPRAVRHCTKRIQESLHQISGTPMGNYSNVAEQLCGKLNAELSYITIDDVFQNGRHEFIDDLQKKLNNVGQGLIDTFFVQKAEAQIDNIQVNEG